MDTKEVLKEEESQCDFIKEDLIDLMKCKNCLKLVEKEGKYFCRDDNSEVDLDNHCSSWTENFEIKSEIKQIYKLIVDVLREFIITKQDNYDIIALWIIGTHLHDNFPSFPYLYINAMKGSAKTRLLKLIKSLSYNGDMLASLSEAVLFRTTGTLCIDEFESINSREKNSLRELLNTAYKKGGKVKRMKKVRGLHGEEQKVEEFDTYRPIVIANIYGMEEVLQDRCINIILEKSDDPIATRLVEDYENHPKCSEIRKKLAKANFKCRLCRVVTSKNIYIEWNDYVKNNTKQHTTLTTLNNIKQHLFKKIYDSNITGRNLELTLPLFMVANEVGKLDDFTQIITKVINERKEDDFMESRDIMLFDFVSRQEPNSYLKIKELVTLFRETIQFDPNEEHWLNAKWLGRALKRLNLIIERRRIGTGREVVLNIEKANDKIKMFR